MECKFDFGAGISWTQPRGIVLQAEKNVSLGILKHQSSTSGKIYGIQFGHFTDAT